MAKKRITAGELMAELNSDPEWVRDMEERQAQHAAKVAEQRAELEPETGPMMEELHALGVKVVMNAARQLDLEPEERPGQTPVPIKSVWDLVNTPSSYPEAIPILAKYLQVARHPVLRNGLARSLTVKEARGAAGRVILHELKSEKDPAGSEERWALANALTMAADESMEDELRTLIHDPRFADVQSTLTKALEDLRKRVARRQKKAKKEN